MIVIRVELHSAITRQVTELGRMTICNDGKGTAERGTYLGKVLRGRSRAALDRGEVQRSGTVTNYPRKSSHVWNLVAQMLRDMGYGGAV